MEKIFDKAKGKLSDLSSKGANLLEKEVLQNIKDASIDKINAAWQQIESASAVFQKSGYSVTEIIINLGLSPTLTIELDQIENINDEMEEALLEEYKGKTFLYTILIAIFKANAIQKSINSVQYKFVGLTIGLGLTPNIDMKFKKVDGVGMGSQEGV